MPTLSEIKSQNLALGTTHPSLTAVFFGATSGIGEGALRAFVKHVHNPTVYIVGRSEVRATSLLREIKEVNPRGKFVFVEGNVAVLKECDRVCEVIKGLVVAGGDGNGVVNLLFQSQGYVSYSGREENADGVDNSMALRYYNRIRIMQNLLPLLRTTSTTTLSRAISVLAGGKEGNPILTDLDLKTHYSILNAASHTATMTTLSMSRLAQENPNVEFVHAFPGLVSTSVFTKGSGPFVKFLMGWVFLPFVTGLGLAMSQEDAGERQCRNSTADLGAARAARRMEEKGGRGGNMFTLDSYGDETNGDLVKKLVEASVQDTVWEFTQSIFKRVCG